VAFLRPFGRLSVAAAATVAALCAATPARADAESNAKDLFARARDLRTNDDCGSAVPLFRKAYAIYPKGLGSLRNVAECEETLGRFASARRAWLDIKRALITMARDPKYDGWDKDATEAAARLQPKIATVFVEVIVASPQGETPASDRSGVDVFVNGENLGAQLVSTPIERDPGRYRIRAQTEHARPVETEVTLVAGDTQRVTLRLLKTPPEGPVATPAPETIDTDSGKRTAGWVLVGVGGAALVGSGITFLLRQGAKSDLESACPGYESAPCPASSRSAVTDATDTGTTMSTLTSVLLPVGLVSAAAGVGLLLWGNASKQAASATSSLRVVTGLGRVDATWRF
jgi:hypothetical protein